MAAKPEEEKPKNLDSLSFLEVRNLLERICKILSFRFIYSNYPQPTWFLEVDNDDDTVVFLDGSTRGDEFQTAKELLRGILNSRSFTLRSFKTCEEKIIQNPLYSSDLSALQIKLDLLSAK